ncbi:hypothetical protein Poli38472_005629 [Pythium oligandrum]|uniref:Uncharacterized protein n=1 Tax=Pythium oligandrum TaxID=41045 RepID=A0A8K1CHR6_PYTOL|nr:hypothetical protein Poli38472_005629 [Pythium oligandrum]|eukprot:TMW63011.1 hypothetical protein Poli38472_005629 [Pythium oligandrum]
MLAGLSTHLAARRVILASQSPRRLELLRECGLVFDVIPSTFEENLPKERFPSPEFYVLENARLKALEVIQREVKGKETPHLVIGCDTVVVHDGVILEKPADEDDAFATLTKLSGKTHVVYSGVALFTTARGLENPHLFFEKTTVTFGPLDASEILTYIKTGEPMDKAGSYGIQGRARSFVSEIQGCYNNVMGFPVQRFCSELRKLASYNEL